MIVVKEPGEKTREISGVAGQESIQLREDKGSGRKKQQSGGGKGESEEGGGK